LELCAGARTSRGFSAFSAEVSRRRSLLNCSVSAAKPRQLYSSRATGLRGVTLPPPLNASGLFARALRRPWPALRQKDIGRVARRFHHGSPSVVGSTIVQCRRAWTFGLSRINGADRHPGRIGFRAFGVSTSLGNPTRRRASRGLKVHCVVHEGVRRT